MIKQQSQQVDQDLYIEHCNYNFKITLFLFLDLMDHKTWHINRARSIIGPDPSSNNVVDMVLAYLPLNTKQKIIVCKIMRHIMCNTVTPRPKRSNQLLFIIRGKDGIGKSQVIKAIGRAYNIIGKSDSIFITTSITAATNNISKSTLHIALKIDTQKIKEIVRDQ